MRKYECPKCGSKNYTRLSAESSSVQEFSCKKCGYNYAYECGVVRYSKEWMKIKDKAYKIKQEVKAKKGVKKK